MAADCWPQGIDHRRYNIGIDLVYGDTEAEEVAKQLSLSGRKYARGYTEFKEEIRKQVFAGLLTLLAVLKKISSVYSQCERSSCGRGVITILQ